MPKNTSSGAPKKARWSTAKKADAQRGPKKPHRGQSASSEAKRSYADRPARDDRAPRREFNRDDRPARSFNRDDRPARSFDRDDRAPRREFNRDDRPGPQLQPR